MFNVLHRCTAATSWREMAGMAGLVMLLLTGTARADIVVIGSDAVQVRVGAVLADTETLEVPNGARVRIMIPSGRTLLVKGPQSIVAGDLAKDGTADVALWNDVTQRLNQPLPEDEAFTRGLAAASAPKEQMAFSWHEVPVQASGEICVEKGAPLYLVRPEPGAELAVTVVDMQGPGKRAKAVIADGQKKAPWPADLEPHPGTFALQPAGGEPRRFRLRLIAPLPDAEEAVRVLHGQRCEMQRNALLDALRNPGFDLASLPR